MGYPIYMMGLYLAHMKRAGGIEHFSALAEQRSTMLYETFDTSGGYYKAPVDPSCRSRVNAPFVIKGDDAALTKKFLAGAEAEGPSALAGHRSVGGCRASLYNALPVEAVAKLCVYMKRSRRPTRDGERSTVRWMAHCIEDAIEGWFTASVMPSRPMHGLDKFCGTSLAVKACSIPFRRKYLQK